MNSLKDSLFSDSVVVTGTHYSMSTLMGEIIGSHRDINLIHEPLKHLATLGHEVMSTKCWYEFFDHDRSKQLSEGLKEIQFGERKMAKVFRKSREVRGLRDIARVGRFTALNVARSNHLKRGVFKDPFLCFSAKTLQEEFGLYIVATIRHPCGFAESLARRGTGFEFSNLLQEPLLRSLPELREEIETFAKETRPIYEQAAVLWKVVYRFCEKFYLDNPKTLFVRQEDLVSNPEREVQRIMTGVGSDASAEVLRFAFSRLQSSNPVDFSGRGKSYTMRNAKGASEKWRERMNSKEIDCVMTSVGDLATRFGYE